MPLNQIMKYIPSMFITKDIGMRTATRVFESPIKVSPSSSGRGEAIMSAPSSGDSHFTNPKWNELKICFVIEGLTESKRLSVNRSRMKRNRIKSPHIAPKAPHRATESGISVSAICASATDAGAIVKTEVQKIPDTKLAIAVLPNNLIMPSIIPE